MNLSTRVLKTLFGRRTKSIDPARHFAVHIQNGYADPITREQFLIAVNRMGGTASLLKKLAATGVRYASRESGSCDQRLAKAIGLKLTEAQKMHSEFEAFVQQLIFSDQNAFSIIEQARKDMAEAIEAINAALAAIDRAVADRAA